MGAAGRTGAPCYWRAVTQRTTWRSSCCGGTYDNAGELTSSALSGATTAYAYNADGQRLTGTQGSTTVASASWNGAAELTVYGWASGRVRDAAADWVAAGISSPAAMSRLRIWASKQVSASYGSGR